MQGVVCLTKRRRRIGAYVLDICLFFTLLSTIKNEVGSCEQDVRGDGKQHMRIQKNKYHLINQKINCLQNTCTNTHINSVHILLIGPKCNSLYTESFFYWQTYTYEYE